LVIASVLVPWRDCRSQNQFDQNRTVQSDKVLDRQPIKLIEPGTLVSDNPENLVWNRLVLIASPRINSGDVDALSETVRDAATKCSLTIMAGIKEKAAAGNGDVHEYELDQIGVGYSADGTSGRVVVTPDNASDLGVSLGFIGRQVLRTNQQQLAAVSVIAKTPQVAVFDAPSVMHRNGKHREYLTRHYVYLDRSTGGGATMTWLLVPPSLDDATSKVDETMSIINEPIRVTKWATRETRNIHVDENEFNFFGVPGKLAFALEDLPPGVDVAWTRRAAKLAGRRQYSQTQIDELSDALNQAMSQAE
ncbi:MAG: hypothetical protein KDB00_15195, partial [Planctomycetales bacterium]|nr:hypothetical protein [Planctomycetales bacterium]